jgi:hypothetical protein
MTISLRKALDENGFEDVKIHMHNPSALMPSRARAFASNPEVWDKIDYASANMYDYIWKTTNPDDIDKTMEEWNSVTGMKTFLSPELCRIRGRAMSLATICLWSANWVVSQTFPMLDENEWLVETFNHGFSFWLYGFMCLILFLFV